MGKQVKRNIHTFPSSKEVISENNYYKISSIDLEKEDSNASSSSLPSAISSDFMEDASSSNGPLFQLSDLMDQLPIKRGLSKYYQGKSQSYASLASVESLEDLAKRENPHKKRIKLRKSFCVGFTSPKATISKKTSYSSSSSFRRNCSNNFMANCRLPPIAVHKDF